MNEFLQFGRRPNAEGTGSIGSWINIMEFLAYLSIPTNLAAIYFSGGNGYGNNGSDTDSPVVMWLMDNDSFWTRSNVILLIVAVEHALLLVKIFLATIIDDVPQGVIAAEKKRVVVHQKAVKFINDYKNAMKLFSFEEEVRNCEKQPFKTEQGHVLSYED